MSEPTLEGFVVGDIPADDPPDTTVIPADPNALTCEDCGRVLTYSGRGRKPKKCDEHKRRPSAPTGKRNASTERLAAQAANVLAQGNSVAVLALMSFSFNGTAAEIGRRNEDFREQAYQALLLDEKLCRSILAAGGKSGAVALLLAYGMLAASVAPVALTEYREVRDRVTNEG